MVTLVLPAKIFELQEDPLPDLNTIFQRLQDFHEEDRSQIISGEDVTLVTEILDLKLEDDAISGVFSRDFISTRYYKRDVVETPITEEAPFWIRVVQGKGFMIVVAPSVARGVKKLLTNHVANKLSDVIFYRPWGIVEVRIPHETLKDLHESNPQATKLIWFDNVDIPSVDKLCLAGSSLADTKMYQEYLAHGQIWYVVFEVQKRSIVVGITRNCVVTLFSKSTLDDFITYILEDFITLIE